MKENLNTILLEAPIISMAQVNQNLCPELEPFYPSIRQRPDIGVLL